MKNKFLLCFMIFSVLFFAACSEKKSKEIESEKSSVTLNEAAKNFADALSNSVEKYGEKINDSTKKYSDEITKSVKEYSDELSESMKKAADEFSNTVNSKVDNPITIIKIHTKKRTGFTTRYLPISFIIILPSASIFRYLSPRILS